MSDSVVARLADLPAEQRHELLEQLNDEQATALLYDWRFWSRPEQQPPEGSWTIWVLCAGRGAGKTRSAAEWIRERVYKYQARRVALVGPTAADVRDTMIEGESGLLHISPPSERPTYEPSKRRVTWPNGAMALCFSADEPNRLRGPQHDTAWAEEVATWRYSEAWDNLMLGLRLGRQPRLVATMTPKPTPLVRSLVATERPDVIVTRGSTYENVENLAEAFFSEIVARYEGSRLGRQELYAELLEDVEGALWSRELIDVSRLAPYNPQDSNPWQAPEQYRRVVVAVDPSWGTRGDDVGIIAAARGFDGHGYVLADSSGVMSPEVWGNAAADLYETLQADRLIAEANFAAEQVRLVAELVARDRGKSIYFHQVHASRGKQQRAEPVVALYEQGRVHHVGYFPALEQQMTSWIPEQKDFSPGRVDALVWALTELLVEDAPSKARLVAAGNRRLPKTLARGR